MKLQAYKVAEYLAAALDESLRVVLLYGRNEGAIREYRAQLITKKLGAEPDPLAVITLTEEDISGAPQRLAEEAAQIPMFGGGKVVVLTLKRDSAPAVLDYLAQPSPQALVIVEAGNLTPASKLRKAVEASESAMALPAYEDDERSVRQLVQQILRQEGWTIAPDALDFLQSRIGQDRALIKQELTRLMLFKSHEAQGALTLDDIIAAGADNGMANIQALTDALLGGQLQKADMMLAQLEQLGTAPLALLAVMRRHLTQLQNARARLDDGQALADAMKAFTPPVHFTRKQAVQSQCQKWSAQNLSRARASIFSSEARCREGGMLPTLAAAIARQNLLAIGRLGNSLR